MSKKTIIIICGSVIGLLVVVLLGIWLISVFGNRYFDYVEVEEKITKAAEKYYKDNETMLPSTDGTYNLSYNTLVEGKYIKPLNKMLKDGDKCTIQISVNKSGVNYSYVPYLNCGEKYITKELYKQIIDDNEIVTSESGLYQSETGEYYFRGKNENNYVALGSFTKKKETIDILWRIISINNKTIKLKKVEPLEKDSTWDDRYNVTTEKLNGINEFDKSIFQEYLTKIEKYENFLTEKEYAKMKKTNLCIGARNKKDSVNDGSIECSVLSKNEYYFGTIAPYEYIRASIDENCTSIESRSCINFNFLVDKSHEEEWTITADTETNYMAYYFTGTRFLLDSVNNRKDVYPTIILNEFAFYDSGVGTKSDPYRLK